MAKKTRAGDVRGVEELARRADRILLTRAKMGLILGRKKCRLVMIEPPGDPGRGRVFEIDNGVFVAGEFSFVEQGPGAVDQAVKLVRGPGLDTFAMKTCEQRC
jgi:hypothetical protein